MKKMPFYCKIKSGLFSFNRPEIFESYCKFLRDGDYVCEISKLTVSKTNEQLGYFHAVIVPTVFQQMKDDENDTKVLCIKGKNGEPHKYKEVKLTEDDIVDMLKQVWAELYNCEVKSKADMSIEEASQLIDTSIKWSARYLGCVIPDPEPQWREKGGE